MNGTPSNPPPLGQEKTSVLAIVSLVLGILAIVLLCVGPVFAIPAVICGHMAYGKIKRSGGALAGKGLAIGGLACGYISLAVLMLLLPIAIPNFIKARNVADSNK